MWVEWVSLFTYIVVVSLEMIITYTNLKKIEIELRNALYLIHYCFCAKVEMKVQINPSCLCTIFMFDKLLLKLLLRNVDNEIEATLKDNVLFVRHKNYLNSQQVEKNYQLLLELFKEHTKFWVFNWWTKNNIEEIMQRQLLYYETKNVRLYNYDISWFDMEKFYMMCKCNKQMLGYKKIIFLNKEQSCTNEATIGLLFFAIAEKEINRILLSKVKYNY